MSDDLTPAVLLLRMSSDDQTASIAQQRKELLAWAPKAGYRIVAEYVDEGLSGSKDPAKRLNWHRLLADAGTGEFKAVLVWSTNRWARLDSIDGAYAAKALKDNRVVLHSMKDGLLDLNTMLGRINLFFKAELDNQYSRDLSADSVRGRVDTAEAGYWPSGPIPYGYHRLYVDKLTGKEHFVKRTERFTKPRNWKLKLVIDPEEAEVVRWIYAEFLKDRPMLDIARELNRRGVPVPDDWYRRSAKKNGWTWDCVKGILKHWAYVGVSGLGLGRAKRKTVFNRATKTQREAACPVIVDRAVWDEVQARLAKNRQEKRRADTRGGMFSGVLYCGQCGCRLTKRLVTHTFCGYCGHDRSGERTPECHRCGRRQKEKKLLTCYVCTSSTRRVPGCPQWRAFEGELIPYVCAKLIAKVDAELLGALQFKEAGPLTPPEIDLAERSCKALKKKYDCVLDGALDPDVPREIRGDLMERAKALRAEWVEADQRVQLLRATQTEGGLESFTNWWELEKQTLFVCEMPNDDPPTAPLKVVVVEPASLHGLLRKLAVQITLHWKKKTSRLYELDVGKLAFEIHWDGQNFCRDSPR